jgi:hypothetical protein
MGSKEAQVQNFAFMVCSSTASNSWVLDSGCSNHLTPDRNVFSDYQQLSSPVFFTFANGQKAEAVGRGTVSLSVGHTQVSLQAVLHVPEAQVNLISVQKITESGAEVEFSDGTCSIRKGNRCVLTVQRKGGLYCLRLLKVTAVRSELRKLLKLQGLLGSIKTPAIRLSGMVQFLGCVTDVTSMCILGCGDVTLCTLSPGTT